MFLKFEERFSKPTKEFKNKNLRQYRINKIAGSVFEVRFIGETFVNEFKLNISVVKLEANFSSRNYCAINLKQDNLSGAHNV